MDNTPDSTVEQTGSFLKRRSEWIVGIGVLGLMITLITPLPPLLLDLLLACNITIAVLLLMVTMNARSALELSTFPTLLLFTTLFRMGLNVASTRRILTGGDAGAVITAFGDYVAGNDIVVGMVVFLILILIQFIVITKGSGRISEVAARFVLDAMPGKQMAIDADLNAGLIDSDEAKERRNTIAAEAEFYGSMDGASKFVRGDAIAGLIITAVNLLGGIMIGTLGGASMGEAVDKFSKLTIGDGLVGQIPALFISTAAGVLVTKDTSDSGLGVRLIGQMGARPSATGVAAGMVFVVGLLPGMPKLPFFTLAFCLALVWLRTRNLKDEHGAVAVPGGSGPSRGSETPQPSTTQERDIEMEELLQVDRLALEIGYRLIPLVQKEGGGGILDHIAQLRRRFASKEGVVLPPVRIRDNIKLQPGGYRLLVGGQEIARGEVEVGLLLAMDPGTASGKIRGEQTEDPAFGLPAWWIGPAKRDEAEILGYTVVDPASVLVTHISETIRKAMADLVTRDDVKALVDGVKEISPAVVEELVPSKMSLGEVQKVLRNLLREEVSVRNMPLILEVLADHVDQTKDAEALTEFVRGRLGRALCEKYGDSNGVVRAVTLEPSVETRLANAVGGSPATPQGQNPQAPTPVSPAWLSSLVERIGTSLAQAGQGGGEVVLLVRSNIRRFLGELVRTSLPKVAVLSYQEVVPARSVETVAVVETPSDQVA